jgi:hypothetical protein
MILFEIDSQGYVKSTPSLIPQGMALSDIVILTESDYELVTLRLIPPSGRYIPDVVCTPVKTQDKSATLWQAILPAEASAMHGVLTYQIFRRNVQGRVIPTQEGALTVQRGVISDMPENVEHLGTYSIESLYNLLTEIHAKDEDHDRGIDKNASDIADLDERVDEIGEKVEDHEESITRLFEITANNGTAIEDFISHTYPTERDEIKDRLTTGGRIFVSKASWGDSEQNVAVQIKLGGNVLKPGTLMVLAPANDATKQIVAEYGMSMKVDETVDGSADGEDIVVLERKPGKIPEANLTFYYAVIMIGGNTTPIATLVGGLGGSGSGGEEFYVGEDEPPATATVWIDPSGDPTNTETWEFVMENGDTVTKELVVVDD